MKIILTESSNDKLNNGARVFLHNRSRDMYTCRLMNHRWKFFDLLYYFIETIKLNQHPKSVRYNLYNLLIILGKPQEHLVSFYTNLLHFVIISHIHPKLKRSQILLAFTLSIFSMRFSPPLAG